MLCIAPCGQIAIHFIGDYFPMDMTLERKSCTQGPMLRLVRTHCSQPGKTRLEFRFKLQFLD